jgi:hypothetical protein
MLTLYRARLTVILYSNQEVESSSLSGGVSFCGDEGLCAPLYPHRLFAG